MMRVKQNESLILMRKPSQEGATFPAWASTCYYGTMALFRAEHITVSYLRDDVQVSVLVDQSFSLEAGCIYDLTGPSGAGKSTMLRVCALMLARQRGELYLDGEPSSSFRPVDWRRRVCLVPQEPSLIPGSVRVNLVLPWMLKVNAGKKPPADEILSRLLELAQLSDVGLDRDVSQLSGGQAARVALLRAFVTTPEVLLLDEVDSALDTESACAVGQMTRALVGPRMTCLRIRHRAPDGFADGAYTLRAGNLSYAEALVPPDISACARNFSSSAYSVLGALGGYSGRSDAVEKVRR